MGADDIYLPGAVRTGVEALMARPEIDVIYGEGNWIDEHDAVISRYPTLPFDPKDLEWDCFICQPASFIRASAYRRCGLDPDVNFSFDYDLWIRMAKQGIRFQMIPQYLAGSRMHQGAKTINERETVFHGVHGPVAAALRLRPVFLGIRLCRISPRCPRSVFSAGEIFAAQLSGQPAGGAAAESHETRAVSERLAGGAAGSDPTPIALNAAIHSTQGIS